MEVWINAIVYQIVWFITVGGAAQGLTSPAWAASAILWTSHFAVSRRRSEDVRLLVLAAAMGIILDGFLTSTALLRYSPATPTVPLFGGPLWILGLWLAFSTTLTRSLGWLRARPWPAIALGAVGGPMAYWAAARGWHVITFEPPQWRGTVALAVGWAMAFSILVRAASRSEMATKRYLRTQT